jgi:hypothetical protein
MLTLTYVPETEDILELAAMSSVRRRLRRRAARNAVAGLVLLGGVFWLNAAQPTSGTLPATLVCALVAVTYLLRMGRLSARRPLRRWARGVRSRSPVLRQAHETELTPEALTLRTDDATEVYAWSRLAALAESDRLFVLMDHAGEPSIALPKRGLPDPSLIPVCRDLLTEYLAAARTAPRTGGVTKSSGDRRP